MTFPSRPDLSTALRRGLFDADLTRRLLGEADRRRASRTSARALGKVGPPAGLSDAARPRTA